ncbi:unnamed protein product [Heligmosomoides polygyrus]|uniref:Chloride channel protein n=1 Tax=Heligmosomoides polygyrus TaxID=6339 RepID=A0A3P8BVR0_HELPZ|nr:unnamed protein product [Heligmosomoides polygyrus]
MGHEGRLSFSIPLMQKSATVTSEPPPKLRRRGLLAGLSSNHKFSQSLRMFLSNCTWSVDPGQEFGCPPGFFDEWTSTGSLNVHVTLSLFTTTFVVWQLVTWDVNPVANSALQLPLSSEVTLLSELYNYWSFCTNISNKTILRLLLLTLCIQFVLSIVSSTLPIPAGIFMPVFVIGASFGRLMGESMAVLFPDGIRSNRTIGIYPGVYAVVGAASFCGSVTHTISVAVIVFELTGQLMHILPVMIAVLVGNIVCSYFQPSIYDSIIMIKALPYIPDVSHCSHDFHTVLAEHIMVSDVKFIWKDITYSEMKEIVEGNRSIEAFPIVLDRENIREKSHTATRVPQPRVAHTQCRKVIKKEPVGRSILAKESTRLHLLKVCGDEVESVKTAMGEMCAELIRYLIVLERRLEAVATIRGRQVVQSPDKMRQTIGSILKVEKVDAVSTELKKRRQQDKVAGARRRRARVAQTSPRWPLQNVRGRS